MTVYRYWILAGDKACLVKTVDRHVEQQHVLHLVPEPTEVGPDEEITVNLCEDEPGDPEVRAEVTGEKLGGVWRVRYTASRTITICMPAGTMMKNNFIFQT